MVVSLNPLCVRLLSDKEGREQEIRSGLFESPHNEPPAMDGVMPLVFGSDALWPSATAAEH